MIMQEKLSTIASDVAEVKLSLSSSINDMNKKILDMQQKIDKQSEVILQQQLFLEKIDRRERETNLVLLGVPDERVPLEGTIDDDSKVKKVFETLQVSNPIRSHRRLGRVDAGGNRPRPILVTLATKAERDAVVEKGKELKNSREPFRKIFVKKDTHPAVREEWRRLHDVEKREKEKPENAGCVIRLDYRLRKIFKDDIEIDSWNPHPF